MTQTLKNRTDNLHRGWKFIAVLVLCVVSLITFSSDDHIMNGSPVARVSWESVRKLTDDTAVKHGSVKPRLI
jgi:hypothetical protein